MNLPAYEILLIEDDPADAELTVLSLKKKGLASRVKIVRDGAEALDFLFCRGAYAGDKFETPPRLVFLDLKLPRISGYEVLRAIKSDERTRPIPVVVLSSSSRAGDVTECYRLGANSYLQKPVNLEKFQEMLGRASAYWLGVNQGPPTAVLPAKAVRGER